MSENSYRAIFENSADAILIIKNGRFVDCNLATVKMLRYKTKEEFLNTHPSVLSPEYQPDGKLSYVKADEMMHLAFENGNHRFEWDHKKADGEIFPVEVLLTAVVNNNDEKILHTVWRDITDRKLADKKLKDNELTYRSLFENSADGMFLFADVFQDCNKSVCALFNCCREDIIGKTPVDFSPEFQPDGKSSKESAIDKINAAYNGIPQRFYWKHKTKDNVLFDADVALNAITIKGKQVIHAVVRDISETIKLEKVQKALFEISEAAYTATDMVSLYKLIHEIVSTLMLAKNFYIAIYDEKTEMISFPYMVDEFDPPYPPKKLGKGLTEYILKTGEAQLIDSELDLKLRKTGEVEMIGTPTLIWLGVPLKVKDKAFGVIVVQDYQNAETYGEEEKQLLMFVAEQIAQAIERKKNSEAIKTYTEQLKQLNLTKDKFFSIIAHDLKSPFQSLLGLSELLTSPDAELTLEEKEDYIQTLFVLLKNQYELLQNLLEWGAMQIGKSEYIPERINLFEITKEKIELLSVNANKKNIKIINEIGKNIFVLSDKHMLGSVLQNFIANAVKFTNRNGTIKIYSSIKNDFVATIIEDDGVGISKEALANIYSLDSVHTTKGTEGEIGTGLGLMLCKEMIEKQEGTLNITSEVNRGTKVCFTIPIPKE